ncbi:MAG: tyrosinase family protein [Chitinophagaceae bacterium]|nr:tyrosinase family protein [Oligoflexus sp.]
MNSLNRRTLLALFSGTALATGCRSIWGDSHLSGDVDQDPTPVIRHRWEPGKDADYKKKFIQAVTLLKANDTRQRPAGDPQFNLSWNKILKIHQMSCQHKNWFLLPYHRLYLLYFESACQVVLDDPTFGIPYWDWTLDLELPNEFYDAPALQMVRSLEKGARLNEAEVGRQNIDKMLSIVDFEHFHSFPPLTIDSLPTQVEEGDFERTPHDSVHNGVGGKMSNPSDSPVDPIFWLHHSNIDRLWGMWLSKHLDSVIPYLTLSVDERLHLAPGAKAWGETAVGLDINLQHPTPLVDVPGIPDLPQFKYSLAPVINRSSSNRSARTEVLVKDLIASDKLPYLYDTDGGLNGGTVNAIAIASAQQGANVRKPRIRAILSGVPKISTTLVTSTVSIDDVQKKSLHERMARPNENSASIYYTQLSIPLDETIRQNVRLYFFIAAPDKIGPLVQNISDKSHLAPEFVGVLSFFPTNPAHQHGHGDPQKTSGSIDITAWLALYLSRTVGKELTLLAAAVNIKDGFKPVPLFAINDKAELNINLSLSDPL